jgi:hypothetical protein
MIDPTTLATILQAVGQSAPTAAAVTSTGIPPMPVSAISQAPAQLAKLQSVGGNNIASTLASMGATPPASAPSPAPANTGGIGGFKGFGQKLGKAMDKIDSEMPQHHPLVQSAAQFMPLEAPRANPYAPTAPSSLFDMLKSMYGA